jgi:putative membrane protein insertion efficiency factor
MGSGCACAPGAAGRCSRRAAAAAGPGSRPDPVNPRPCDVRGPGAGPPAAERPDPAPVPSGTGAGPRLVRGRASRGLGGGPKPRSAPALPRRGPGGGPPGPWGPPVLGGAGGPDHAVPGAGAPRRGAPRTDEDQAVSVDRPSIPARVLAVPVRAWRGVSAHLPARCRFHPSCSAYAIEALERHGARRGAWLAIRRVGRCHPWHPGGLDPVPAATNVRSHHRATPRLAGAVPSRGGELPR